MFIVKNLRKSILTFSLLLGLLTPLAFAGTANAGLFDGAKQEACAGAQLSTPLQPCDKSAQEKLGGPNGIITKVVDLMSIIVGVIAVIMIIISGIRFVTSNGDTNKITSARNTFIYALVGLVLVAFAQVIVKLVLTKIA